MTAKATRSAHNRLVYLREYLPSLSTTNGLYGVLEALLTMGIKKAQLSLGLWLKRHQNYENQPDNGE